MIQRSGTATVADMFKELEKSGRNPRRDPGRRDWLTAGGLREALPDCQAAYLAQGNAGMADRMPIKASTTCKPQLSPMPFGAGFADARPWSWPRKGEMSDLGAIASDNPRSTAGTMFALLALSQ